MADYILTERLPHVLYSEAFLSHVNKKAVELGVAVVDAKRIGLEQRIRFSRDLTPAEAASLQAHESMFFHEEIKREIEFGRYIMLEFMNENIGLGITVQGKTKDVRKAMAEVINALSVGALVDAISEIRLIPNQKKDGLFISDARMLYYINKIEAFAGLDLSKSV